MTISTYSELADALNTYQKRTYTTAQFELFLGNFESWANRRLGQDYRREVTTTITTNADGMAALPSGFTGMRSIVRASNSSYPLKQVTWASIIERNPNETASEPMVYAISGALLRVSPIAADDFDAIYWSTLTALNSSSSTSNWLLAAAPDAYFFGVLAQAKAYHEDLAGAVGFEQKTAAIIDELNTQAVVASHNMATITIPGPTP